jgi:DNA-binding transcriptional LysR family regulator
MWWENLAFLDELVRSGSMRSAARSLRVDKATVSRRLAELERTAPTALFERHAGQFVLTTYGERAIHAYRAHELSRRQLAAELECVGEQVAGSVRMTMPGFFACEVVARALPDFLAAHEQLDVEIASTSRTLDVARGEVDLALRNILPSSDSLSVRKVGRLALATFASRAYLAHHGSLVAPRDLTGHSFIVYDTGPYAGPGFEWMNDALQRARITFSANDALLLRAAAVAGLGLVTLPAFMGHEHDQLVQVPDAGEGVTDLWLVAREEQRRVPRVRALHQFVSDLVREEQPRLCPVRAHRLPLSADAVGAALQS